MTSFPTSTLYIDGKLCEAQDARLYDVVAPATGKVVGQAADAGTADMDAAIAAARRCFDETAWSTDVRLRVDALRRLQAELRRRADANRARVAAETGSAAMVMAGPGHDLPIEFMDWTLELAENYEYERKLGPTQAFGNPTERIIVREAAGVAGAITPWNVPMQINLAKITPALAAGCTVVLKAAPETPWTAALLGEAAAAVDFPAGALNIITSSDKVGVSEQLVSDSRVDLISFTGSTATGRRVMETAAATLKRVFLELGGKSANIILDDAPFPQAIYSALTVCYHAGQGCAITTRLLVPRERHDEAAELATQLFASLPYGDPDAPDQMLSPVISETQRQRILQYIQSGIEDGATLMAGGKADDRNGGYYVEPTVFANVDNSMRIAQEEIFGPVLAIIPYDDDDHAVQIANDSIYGLSGSIQSGNTDRALAMAKRIRTGTVNINNANVFAPDSPFGGYKQSGIGREMGVEGFEEYLQLKVIGVEV
ncbi:aldehyde dehydrogenase [Croceicoccus estronivorus]|uniref:aldehyde dehydrogenase family protein n=1 Tax=Croceicoccus estronivorus TaxID=1172626 RepID=UPI000834D52D|nr:aldehyde dehydrogenase family protein [Croceicoccus estronivorus]OCC23380.1 aldehyde dehydrogenase [Croceicoccus estronivorus]